MGATPAGKCHEHRFEGAARVRQRILHPGRDLGEDAALNKPVGLESAEPVGERLGADAVQRATKLPESLGAAKEIADDEDGPLSVKGHQRSRDGATAVFARLKVAVHSNGSLRETELQIDN